MHRDARRNKHLKPTSIAAAYLSRNVVDGVVGRRGFYVEVKTRG